MNELTGGESSASNVELIKNNAKLGAQIAVALSKKHNGVQSFPLESNEEKLEAKEITIIGGMALDILSMSESLTTDSGSSHIGKITLQEGGSARNVAECLARIISSEHHKGALAEKSD